MKPAVIQITNLTKAYDKDDVLKDINLTIHAGQLTALVGSNGMGKSTLLRILARADFPDTGDAIVMGRSIHKDDPAFSADIGFVSELIEYHLPMNMAGILKFLAKIHKNWNPEIATNLAQKFELDLNKKFHEISRGQKMQFVFLVECARQPKLLILDEITSVLDASIRRYVMKHLESYSKAGGAVLIATNILSEVEGFADRLLILNNGRIEYDKLSSEFDPSFESLEDLFIHHTRKVA